MLEKGGPMHESRADVEETNIWSRFSIEQKLKLYQQP